MQRYNLLHDILIAGRCCLKARLTTPHARLFSRSFHEILGLRIQDLMQKMVEQWKYGG